MSLRINGWRGVLKWGVMILVGVAFLVFFIRVVTFEDAYFKEKHGSERAVAEETTEQDEELIEVKPTEEEVVEYTVAADRPRYLSIEKLGVEKARVLPVGINSDGELGTPNNIFDVGWYESSGKPGQGKTMLIDGHNGGPHVHGVFKDLPSLGSGDRIVVERGDGAVFTYIVVENIEVPLDRSDVYMATAMKSPESGKESLTLISCTGEWSQAQGTYLSRQFTRAVLLES
ncbi:class F sortase [Candidatus Saccharibacteria bacterium]|nr:class F sortase [Candidatus Saccharibacteria bacterium]